MGNTASLKKEYTERIAPALKSQFQYSSSMQVPVLKKIVINQGLGMAVADKKIIDVAINEISHLSYIKWMNHKFNSKLNFKNCCKVGSCYKGTECVSIVQWLGKINAHPTNAGKKHFTERDIIDFEQKNCSGASGGAEVLFGGEDRGGGGESSGFEAAGEGAADRFR